MPRPPYRTRIARHLREMGAPHLVGMTYALLIGGLLDIFTYIYQKIR